MGITNKTQELENSLNIWMVLEETEEEAKI